MQEIDKAIPKNKCKDTRLTTSEEKYIVCSLVVVLLVFQDMRALKLLKKKQQPIF